MDTEIVRDTAKSFYLQIADDILPEIESLNKQLKAIPWEGGSKDGFLVTSNQLFNQIQNVLIEGCGLLQKVMKEVDGWLAVDNSNALKYINLREKVTIIGAITASFAQMSEDINKLKFKKWWNDRSEKEKIDFIKAQLEIIARKLGIEILPFEIENLDGDTGGDFRPLYGNIRIDSDQLTATKVPNLIATLAHESRHKYQYDCVSLYEQTGKVPDGLSIDVVKSWKENMDNYISLSDNFKAYSKQAIEVDASAFGENYQEQFFDQGLWISSGGW